MINPERTAKGMWWDRAWTVTKGCSPVSEGCKNCWSAAQSHIRSKQAKPPEYYTGVTNKDGDWNWRVEPVHKSLDVPLRRRIPTTYALWNDLFHEAIPDGFIAEVIRIMMICPQHTFQVLTKRPERMREILSRWGESGAPIPGHTTRRPLSNVWLGASGSTQKELDRVAPDLLATPAAVRFLSLEPLLEPITLDRDTPEGTHSYLDGFVHSGMGRLGPDNPPSINLVIAGCESGPKRRKSEINWFRYVKNQCARFGVPFFLKQIEINGRVSKNMDEWPEDLRVREYPCNS